MHSSRMCTARSLTISCHILCTPCNHAHPPTAMHGPLQPCMPPSNHAHMHPTTTHAPPSNHACPPATTHAPNHTCPLATMHTPRQPCTPPNHTCPPATMHAPRQPCTTPGNNTRPPRGQTHTCKNITFANYVCGR